LEHELFCWYFKRLKAFLAQCDYCVGKWEILGILDEGVNSETRIILQYWDFHCKCVDKAWCLLEWIAWESFGFEEASRLSGYFIPSPRAFYARSYYAPLWCDMCSFSDHNAYSCPYYACYVQPDFAPPRDNDDVILNLSNLPLPLGQHTGFEGGEPFGYVTRLSGVSACLESEDKFDMTHNLVDTLLEGCHDMFAHEGCLGCDDGIPNSLEHSHVSSLLSQPLFSLDYSLYMPNDISKLCDSNMDLG